MATFSFQFYPHGLTCTSAHAYRKWLQDDLPLGWWNIGRQPEEFTISQSAHSCTGVTRLIEMGKSTTRLRDVLLHFCQAVSLIHVHWCHAISLFSVLVFIMPLLFHWFYSTATDYCLHSGWSQRHESHDTWAPFKMIFGKGVFFLFSLTLTWFPYFIDWTKLRMIVDKNLCPTIDISIQTPKLRVSQMGVVKIHHKCWNPNPINELSVASHQLSTKSARTRAAPSMGAWRMSRLRPVLFRKDPETASVACLEQQTEGNRKGPKQPPSWFITFYSYVKWGLQRTCVELDRCMTV